ncbi:hypothetical protein F5Y16DRAFT_10308 [Xylariaceae sp. FL0255]|nr:hypothetical protein F5Y16DRAFT_10308 [Xylariaceae sp. FL0255]
MPADYSSAAQALSLPLSPSPSPEPNDNDHHDNGRAPRRPNTRRLSTPYARSSALPQSRSSIVERITKTSLSILQKLIKLGNSMTPAQQILAVVGGLAALAVGIVFLVFSHRIFAALEPIAEGWRNLPGGWVLLFLLTCVTSFPPMIGYSTAVTVAGFVFGFPGGWPIVAAASVVGSTGAFVASRTVLSAYVQRLVGSDRRFVAFGQVLRHDGLPMLAAIRAAPLPFSLSNGFLATIPSISPLRFALATAIASPKLLVHVFIGSRLAKFGEDMSSGDRVVNSISIAISAIIGLVVGLVVFRRTMQRAKELALEEGGDAADVFLADDGDHDAGYEDLEEGVLSGETDAAALMSDDDISLWDTTEELHGVYRDVSSDEDNTTISKRGADAENTNTTK